MIATILVAITPICLVASAASYLPGRALLPRHLAVGALRLIKPFLLDRISDRIAPRR
jgi:hypothetical protein